jgi:hypothetical protein
MGRNINDLINSLPPEHRAKIEVESKRLLDEYQTRQQIVELVESKLEFTEEEGTLLLGLVVKLLGLWLEQ